jgi:ketosteroid isomerase-like protein
MEARTPEDLPLVFERHFNAGDVDGLMRDYYAPSATYAPLPGQIVSGPDDVRASIGELVALGHPMSVSVRHVLRSGDVALLVVDWEIPALGLRGTATDVARCGPDGVWRCVIDNPHGGAREVAGVGGDEA